jgi:NTE family protein
MVTIMLRRAKALKTISVVFAATVLAACSSPNVDEDLNSTETKPTEKHELGVAFGGGGVQGFMHRSFGYQACYL